MQLINEWTLLVGGTCLLPMRNECWYSLDSFGTSEDSYLESCSPPTPPGQHWAVTVGSGVLHFTAVHLLSVYLFVCLLVCLFVCLCLFDCSFIPPLFECERCLGIGARDGTHLPNTYMLLMGLCTSVMHALWGGGHAL